MFGHMLRENQRKMGTAALLSRGVLPPTPRPVLAAVLALHALSTVQTWPRC